MYFEYYEISPQSGLWAEKTKDKICSIIIKLVRFYKRIGFKVVHEVTGSSIGDLAHMLLWGGIGTRMDANITELLLKWCTRFKSPN
ncbi:hypothetical protein ACSBR1_019681 [Camellia fascicularis]